MAQFSLPFLKICINRSRLLFAHANRVQDCAVILETWTYMFVVSHLTYCSGMWYESDK